MDRLIRERPEKTKVFMSVWLYGGQTVPRCMPSNAVAHNISNVIGLSTHTSADVATLSFSPWRGGFPPADCRFHVVFAIEESYFFAAEPEVKVPEQR